MHGLNLVLLLFSAAALLVISFTNTLNKAWIPYPLLALIYGAVIGPHGLGWLAPEMLGERTVILKEGARLTLAIGLMGIALRLPIPFWRLHWKPVALLLGVALPVMVVTGMLSLQAFLDYGWLWCLAVAAALAPTDPIVSSMIVTGNIATSNVPANLRHTISAESGSNDGLGLIFVLIPIYLLEKGSAGPAVEKLFLHGLLYEIGVALLIGGAMGFLTGRMLHWMAKYKEIEGTSYLGFTLALPLVVVSLVGGLKADGILAVFVAGVVFDHCITDEHQENQAQVQEAINKFFVFGMFTLIGIYLPLVEWWALGWTAWAACLVALLLRRVAGIAVVRWIPGFSFRGPSALFLGWFGTVGIAATYYAQVLEERSQLSQVWAHVSLVVTLALILQGITATPFAKLIGQREQGDRPTGAPG